MPYIPPILKQTNGRRQKWRGKSTERGYDNRWRELRDCYAATFPLCEVCDENGIHVTMDEVDHIIPISGRDDPLRLEWDNLQSLCRRCHAIKTDRNDADIIAEYNKTGDIIAILSAWRHVI